MKSLVASIPSYVMALFAALVTLASAVFICWGILGRQVYTPHEQLTMLPVHIHSAQYKTVYCRRRNGVRYICDQYHELKAIHRTEKHQYTLRMMGSAYQRHQFPVAGSVRKMRTDSLLDSNVNVWVDENNHWLIYQASVVGNPDNTPMPPAYKTTWKQLQDWMFHQATMPDKAGNERLILPYEVTRQQLQEKAEEDAKYDPLFWLLALFLTLFAGSFLRSSYQWWREDRLEAAANSGSKAQ